MPAPPAGAGGCVREDFAAPVALAGAAALAPDAVVAGFATSAGGVAAAWSLPGSDAAGACAAASLAASLGAGTAAESEALAGSLAVVVSFPSPGCDMR